MSERIHATYWLETGDDPRRAAEVIAGEQSSGTFVALATETPELKARSGARVERLEVLGESNAPSLGGGMASPRYKRCTLELSWPIENFGPSLPNLMSTIAGNLFELRQVSGLRLTGLKLPPSFARGLSWTGIRDRRHASSERRHAWSVDRHDHQAERRVVA